MPGELSIGGLQLSQESLQVTRHRPVQGLGFGRAAAVGNGGWECLHFAVKSQQIDAMPKSITIREVPDDTRDELAARAARSGRSLQEYLRSQLVDLASQPDQGALLERIRNRKGQTGSTLPETTILRHRDADRR